MTPRHHEAIQTLWIGGALTNLERLSLRSFLAHGHDVHLYTYGEVPGVPDGVELHDGREILPRNRIFCYTEFASYAGFANLFRYHLLSLRGGWWVDTDVVFLRPFDFPAEYVIASECDASYQTQVVTNGIIKAPAASAALRRACHVCDAKDSRRLAWGETGPRLLGEIVRQYELEPFVQPFQVFCPIHWNDIGLLLDPRSSFSHYEATLAISSAIHLWNEVWRRHHVDKDASFAPNCLYERLKERYL